MFVLNHLENDIDWKRMREIIPAYIGINRFSEHNTIRNRPSIAFSIESSHVRRFNRRYKRLSLSNQISATLPRRAFILSQNTCPHDQRRECKQTNKTAIEKHEIFVCRFVVFVECFSMAVSTLLFSANFLLRDGR
jgi:hypothetical protein